MTSSELENYCFLRLYLGDLNEARASLNTLKRYHLNDVRYALVRDVAVTYARPFSGNRGKLVKKQFLSKRYVPREHLPLHAKLIELRNDQLAHSSLVAHDPKVSRFDTGFETIYAMSRKSIDYDDLLRNTDKIQELISSVEAGVFATVVKLQARL